MNFSEVIRVKFSLIINLFIAAHTLNAAEIRARFETDPIKMGKTESDDAAFYYDNNNPQNSEILGVSKCDDEPLCGGMYVHTLEGKIKQTLNVGKLNNIDTTTIGPNSFAFASNREDIGVSVFQREKSKWVHLGSKAIVDQFNRSYEPYGLCAKGNMVAVSSKTGQVYIYAFTNQQKMKLIDSIDLAKAARPYDRFVSRVLLESAKKKKKLHKIDKYMKQRFVSEGCVFDKDSNDLYIAQEKLGIWRYRNNDLTLIKKIQGSHAHANFKGITDDLEGIDIYKQDGHAYLVVSTQGINKILFIDMETLETVRSDSFYMGPKDKVTETDGVLAVSTFTPLFPKGFLVLHDDENTDDSGTLINANYKIIDMRDLKL